MLEGAASMAPGPVKHTGRLSIMAVSDALGDDAAPRPPVLDGSQFGDFLIYPESDLVFGEPLERQWDKELRDYRPPFHCGPEEAMCDPDRLDMLPAPLDFNCTDTSRINRKSFIGNYTIVNGYPHNPRGRVGVAGRGILPRYGPNHYACAVVTREATVDGIPIVTENGPKFEVIAVRVLGSRFWRLPEVPLRPQEEVMNGVRRAFAEVCLSPSCLTHSAPSVCPRSLQRVM
jgi:hypothetical protein